MRERRTRTLNPHIPTRKTGPTSRSNFSKQKDSFSVPKLIALVAGVLVVLCVVAYLAVEQKRISFENHLKTAEDATVPIEDNRSQDHMQEASDRKSEVVDKEDDHLQKINDKKKAEILEKEKPKDEFADMSEEELEKQEESKRKIVKGMKSKNVVMETDPKALIAIAELQKVTRALILKRYGSPPYRVELEVEFPEIMPDNANGRILIELAPIELTPHVVFVFLEIVRKWTGGAFNRVAGHVLQTRVDGQQSGLAFQEYHKDFPHKKFTLGYAGRPGGPAWYISVEDNTRNHGPESQGSKTEADGCFGKVLEGYALIERMRKHPKLGRSGFIPDVKDYFQISNMKMSGRGVKA